MYDNLYSRILVHHPHRVRIRIISASSKWRPSVLAARPSLVSNRLAVNSEATSQSPYVPSPDTYAVIRMDPVAMVEHLNDAEALESAKALRPKSYLVYIDCDHSLPFPGVPWYGFYVHLLAPSLPPTDDERCMTSDMCTPIFPNVTHPLGCPPLVPEPPGSFPSDNCYHWPDMELDIRVLARPEGFDRKKMVRLPAEESLRLGICLAEEKSKRSCAVKARIYPEGGDAARSSGSDTTTVPGNCSRTDGEVAENGDAHSVRTSSSGCSGSWSGSEEFADTDLMDGFFGEPTQNVELLPLVHLWVDMAGVLKQEDIPDPRWMFEERDAIVSIIQAARARNPSLPPMVQPIPIVFDLDLESELGSDNELDADDSFSNASGRTVDIDASGSLASDTYGAAKLRRFRPLKSLRKACDQSRDMFRLPYLLIWP
ncbi:hypothetical protein C8T65DRAFT_618225 [Cerioporus squamosus]|nr:hypothetical protein C8T65DRAFT_618225 [Cerioporus squamosus]